MRWNTTLPIEFNPRHGRGAKGGISACDTFVFRTPPPLNAKQARLFAEEVVPAVKRAIARPR